MASRCTVTILSLLLCATAPIAAQSGSALQQLTGEWVGAGTLFGRPAAFTMAWSPVLGGRFHRLEFTNAFAVGDSTQPVVGAIAYYAAPDSGTSRGNWYDTRGVILPLEAVVGPRMIATTWGSEATEVGRSVYQVISRDSVMVVDSVRTPDGWREFARGHYRRR